MNADAMNQQVNAVEEKVEAMRPPSDGEKALDPGGGPGPGPRTCAIGVLIVDDHPIVREGLSAILATEPGIEVVGQAADSCEALAQFKALRPDVTLLDVHLLNESGLDVLCDIRDLDAEATVLMISAYDHGEDIHRALNLGARGYTSAPTNSRRRFAAYTEASAPSHRASAEGSRSKPRWTP